MALLVAFATLAVRVQALTPCLTEKTSFRFFFLAGNEPSRIAKSLLLCLVDSLVGNVNPADPLAQTTNTRQVLSFLVVG